MKEARGYIQQYYSGGFALIAVVLILAILLIIGAAFFTLVSFEHKIALSQESTFETYYLAEAGINEVIYKLRNDSVWQDEFKDGTIDRSISRQDVMFPNSSYEVSIVSTDEGEADMVSVGKLDIYGAIAQRVVKTKVIRAVNPNPLADTTIFANTDIRITLSSVQVPSGDIFANDDIELFAWSSLDVAGRVQAVDEIDLFANATLIDGGGCFSTNCPVDCSGCNPAPAPVTLPMLDFDSDDENSYKSKAGAVYTEADFRNLLDSGPVVLNDDVTYVEGDVRFRSGHDLTVNGILVADGNIVIGGGGNGDWDDTSLEVVHTPGRGSGLLSKNSIEFIIQPWGGDVNIAGVLYAVDRIRVMNLGFSNSLSIVGSVIGREVEFFAFWGDISLEYDEDTVVKTLFGPPADAPVVTIEHWEEEY